MRLFPPNASSLLFLLLLTAVPSAQGSPARHLVRYQGSLQPVTLDLATGTVSTGPRAAPRSLATTVEFTNIDLGGFVGLDSGGGACQWIDAAVKGAGNASDLMSSIVFAYCSSALDPSVGGPGGSTQLGFYEGYTAGGPAPTTSVLVLNLTGLPATTSCGFRCFYLAVTFPNLVAFADGPIGYSWLFTDLDPCGQAPLAATFPFLSCVQSCSGMGPDGQGMVDRIDQYCPPGNLLSSFSFGTTSFGSYFTSMSMEIREASDLEATATSWNSQGINVDRLDSNAILLGGTWTASVAVLDPHGPGSGQPMTLTVRTACIDGANATSPLGGRPVELLLTGPVGLRLAGTHGPQGTSAAFPGFPVPPASALVGATWAAQATVVGGGFADLTSARCGTIGAVDAVPDP